MKKSKIKKSSKGTQKIKTLDSVKAKKSLPASGAALSIKKPLLVSTRSKKISADKNSLNTAVVAKAKKSALKIFIKNTAKNTTTKNSRNTIVKKAELNTKSEIKKELINKARLNSKSAAKNIVDNKSEAIGISKNKIKYQISMVSQVLVQPANKAASIVKKVVQDNIDATLLKLSPNMQKTLDALVSKIEQTPVHIQDFQALACRVLKHANEINESIKQKIITTSVKIKS